MADVQFTVSALDKATAALLKVAAQLDKVGDKLDKLDGKVARIGVALEDKGAAAGLDNIERKVKNLDGKKATVKVDVDKSLGDSLIKFNLLGKSMKNIALGAGVIAAAPQIAALGSALVTASGAAGAIPGIFGAAALAVGTLKVGFTGLGDALGPTGTPAQLKKVNAALALLPPNAKAAVAEIRNLGPAWSAVRLDVQQRLFEGVATQIKGLAATYLPMLHTEMSKTATVFNVAATSVSKFFQQKSVSTDMQGALMSLRLGVTNVILAARPLAQVFVDIFSTSAARIPGLTAGIAGLATKFAGFIANARQTGQLGQWIDQGVSAVKALGQVVVNVGSILLSVFRAASAQGATLFQTLADVTGKMADFLKSAQGQSAIKAVFDTIRSAIAAITPVVEALLPLLSTALVAAGTSLVRVFQALGPPLKDIATALANALAPVLPGIADAFGRIALALVPVVAPAQALIPAFHAIAAALSEAAKVAADFFSAMAATGVVAFRALVPLVTAAVQALTGLLHVIEPIAPALGVIVGAFLAFKAASAGIALVQGALGALGGKISEAALNAGVLTEKFTGSANAGEKVATAGDKVSGAFSKVGAALPVIGIGIAAISMAYEEFGGKADQAAAKVIDGSLSMQTAIAQEADQIHRNQIEWLGGMNAQESYAAASVNVRAELDKQLATLGPMARLQADVTMAQTALNDAVAQFGPKSAEAQTAAGVLAAAKDRLKTATQGAADAEKGLGDKILDTQRIMAGAASADIGYQQSLLTLKEAESAYAQAVADHGIKSDEAAQADLRLQQAHIDAATAAATKAEAEAKAAGVTDTSTIKAQAFKEELLRQAETMTGPSKQALIDLANGTVNAGDKADIARLQSEGYKTELDLLGRQAGGPTKDAIDEAKRKLDEIAGSHSTADEKARLQRDMLQHLAEQCTGPTRTAIEGLITNLGNIPEVTTFTVQGEGKVSYGSPELLRAAHGGYTGGIIRMNRAGITGVAYADGGVTPGYTPGRDVHTYRSATGGTLELSGGEAVMRPEWTAAVGASNVHRMNAAARSSGVAGVRRHMGLASGGILPGKFARGDVVLTGTPFASIPPQIFNTVAGSLVSTITSVLQAAIKALIAQVQAMARAVAGAVAGAVGLGGGSARAWIIAHESGGNPTARNPTSTASGLYQFINGTWKAYGGSTPTAAQASVAEQNAVADRYVAARYGSWENAKAFWIAHGWYDRGGMLAPGVTMAVNNTGRAERVLSPAETHAYGQRGGNDALLTELRQLNGTTRMLRGDVDQGGYFAELIGQVRALRAEVASSGRSVTGEASGARYQAALGAF